jgi:type IV secretory pathway VirB4 component
MINVARHLREFADVGAMNQLLKLSGWFTDTTYLTKTGALGCVYHLTGVDYEGTDAAFREDVVHRFMVALRPFDERFRVYQYLEKRRVPPFMAPACRNPAAEAILRARADDLNARRETLYVLDLYLVVEIDGPPPRRSSGRSVARERQFVGQELDRAAKRLQHAAHGFETSLNDVIRQASTTRRRLQSMAQRIRI